MSSLGIQLFPVFLVSAVMLSLLPGPATMYIVGRSLAQGRRAGLLSVAGICGGTLCHIVAVAFGVSALYAASQLAFVVVKTLGAIYLAYIGIGLIRTKAAGSGEPVDVKLDEASDRRILAQGWFTQILNPKVTLFFLSILPQFVAPCAGHRPLPFLILGAAFVAIDVAWFSTLACSAAAASRYFVRSARAVVNMKRSTGVLYVLLAFWLARQRMQAAH